MKLSDKLKAVYDVSGVRVHKYKYRSFGGNCFGDIETPTKCRATGYELAESIRIAQDHVAEVEHAIRNMQNILDHAIPVEGDAA